MVVRGGGLRGREAAIQRVRQPVVSGGWGSFLQLVRSSSDESEEADTTAQVVGES